MAVKVSTSKSKPKEPDFWSQLGKTAGVLGGTFGELLGKGISSAPGFGGGAQGWGAAFSQPKAGTRARKGGGSFGGTPVKKVAPPQEPASNPFMDFLNSPEGQFILGAGGSGGGSSSTGIDFGGQRQQATQTAQDASAKLQAMYNALHNQIQGDAPGIQQNFDQGIQSVGAASDAASGDVNKAYDAARQAQTAQLAALGIGDAAGVIQGKGESSANDQARAISNIAQNQAADQTLLNTSKTGSLNYNGQIANAASQAGTDKAAAVQQALSQRLQDISDAEMQAQAQASQAAGSGNSDIAQMLLSTYLNESKQNDANALNAAKLGTSSKAKQQSDQQKAQQGALNQAIALMKAQPGISFADALASINSAYK